MPLEDLKNRAERRKIDPWGEEQRRGQSERANEEFSDLRSALRFVRAIKLKRLKWTLKNSKC
jgi:hypothetical protein